MMPGPQKTRAERTLALARELLVEEGVEVRQQVNLIPLAHILKERAGVSYDTAKRHVHRAVMLARGEMSKTPEWGGKRERPPPAPAPPPKTVTIKADVPIHASITHPGGGYEHLGRGKAELARSGAERIIRVDLGAGRTLVLMVF